MRWRRWCWTRPSLSATDLALLIVMAVLVKAHLETALAVSLVSLLFGVLHIAIFVLTLLHCPAAGQGSSHTDLMLAWAGMLLPLAMRATTAPVWAWALSGYGNDSCKITPFAPFSAS